MLHDNLNGYTQHTWDIDPVFVYCWSNVCDVGPAVNEHQVNSQSISMIFLQALFASIAATILHENFIKFEIVFLKVTPFDM